MNEDKLLLWFWFGLLVVMGLIYPLFKGSIHKCRDLSKYDSSLQVRASWMDEGIEVIYPGEARKKDMEGSATLDLEFDCNGKLLGSTLIKSSSHEILDNAAISVVSNATLSAQSIESNAEFKQQLKNTFRLKNDA